MTDNKISKQDQSEWDAYICHLNKTDEDDIAEFEEAIEDIDFATEFSKFDSDQIPPEPKKSIRLQIKTKNLRAPQSFKKGVQIDSTLDLHGKSTQNAYISFIAFIESSYLHDNRNLLIITGKGTNSPEGIGAIKKEFKDWIAQENIANKIVRTTYAHNKDGGEGAFYVFLKKRP